MCTACAHPGLEGAPLGRQQRVGWLLHLEALNHQRVAKVGEVEQAVELVPLGLGLGLGFGQGLGFDAGGRAEPIPEVGDGFLL